MYLEELVEVAIGLILAFLFVSFATMQVQEFLSGLLRWRSTQLKKSIREMLVDPGDPPPFIERVKDSFRRPVMQANTGLAVVNRLYEHPLIRSLAQPGKLPSYIPADKFTLALFDTVMTAGTDASTVARTLEQVKLYKEELLDQAVRESLDSLIETVRHSGENPELRARVYEEVHQFLELYPELQSIYDALMQANLPVDPDAVLRRVKEGAATLIVQNPDLRHALDTLIAKAETYAEEGETILLLARANVEKWFDDTMDRASGWYKRNMVWWSLAIGIALAFILNVDAVNLAKHLWREPLLRQTLVKQAENYTLPEDIEPAEFGEAVASLQRNLEGLELPIGWEWREYEGSESSDTLCVPWGTTGDARLRGFPIAGSCLYLANFPTTTPDVLLKFFGLLMTGVAAMQGAPFWFDLLKKIVNVRSSGDKPKES